MTDTVTEAAVVTEGTTQEAPVEAPQVDVDALIARAEQVDPYAFALMGLVRDTHADYERINEAYSALKNKGETPIAELLAGVTDDENATRLAEGIKAIEAKLAEVKEKARELLASKGMISDAQEAELKDKRDSARTQLNKTNELLGMYMSAKPALAEFAPFVEQFKTRKSSASTNTDAAENEKIREWARATGFVGASGKPVGDKGRIAADVVEAYRKAQTA